MVANNVDVDKNQILHQHQIKQGTIVAHLSLPLRFTYVSAKSCTTAHSRLITPKNAP